MAKTTAPLLSFGADGQIAKTMVYSKWKGIPYVRRHVVPANPQTVAQQLTRTTFSKLREMWKIAPAIAPLQRDNFAIGRRSAEHTSELQSLMRNWYSVFC